MVALLVIPLLAAAAAAALRERPRARDAVMILAGLAQVAAVAAMVPGILDGRTATLTITPFLPEAPIALRADSLGVLLVLTASPLWLLTSLYSIGYLRGSAVSPTRFHVLAAVTISATAGVAFSANLVTLYLFYEAMTIATYPLVTATGTAEAAASGRRYLAFQLGTGIAFFLPAVVLTYAQTGSFALTPGGLFGAEPTGFLPILTYLLFLFGIAKAAIIPAHGWLPAAMVAPVPVSALLHAVAVVNVGVFALFRVMLEVFGPDAIGALGLGHITLIVTSVTILVASLIALRLGNLKEILAYSTIGQLSYMVLGIALLNDAGVTGGMLHLLGHAVAKITLFFAVGAIAVGTGATTAKGLLGLGQRQPLLLGLFAVGAASIIGLPPTIGFVTKYFLFIGAAQARQWLVLAVLAASTMLATTYYVRLVRAALSPALSPMKQRGGGAAAPPPSPRSGSPVPWQMLVPTVVTAVLTVLLGIIPGPILTLVRAAIP
jgi:multicomponent Na+:H+ antiporter subunit D